MEDKDKIIEKNTTTKSYVNEKGEHLKFTDNAMSIYSNDPREPHSSVHLEIKHDEGTFEVRTKDENGNKSSDSGNCFLTTACMTHFQKNFDDNCQELTILRWFRNNFVLQEDVKHYYKIAPDIVAAINELPNNEIVYDYIYDNIVDACIEDIKNGNYNSAYDKYKFGILTLEKAFL